MTTEERLSKVENQIQELQALFAPGKIELVNDCEPGCTYARQLPDGTRIKHCGDCKVEPRYTIAELREKYKSSPGEPSEWKDRLIYNFLDWLEKQEKEKND